MITLQHSLVYLSALAKDGLADLEKFKKGIPWTLLPDALRCYTGNREYTHFEESSTMGWYLPGRMLACRCEITISTPTDFDVSWGIPFVWH